MSDPANVFRYDVSDLFGRFDPDNKLLPYFELLLQENSRLNLVSRETARTVESAGSVAERFPGLARLAVESLIPLQSVPPRPYKNYLDIGSGGGFPSLPILLTQDIDQVRLVERTLKKAAALGRMLPGLNRSARIESTDFREIKFESARFDLITMRLVRLELPLLKKIARLLTDDGLFVYYSRRELNISDTKLTANTSFYAPIESSEIHACTLFTKKL